MIQMNLHQVAAIVGASLVGKEARIQGVEIDSRADWDSWRAMFLLSPSDSRITANEIDIKTATIPMVIRSIAKITSR